MWKLSVELTILPFFTCPSIPYQAKKEIPYFFPSWPAVALRRFFFKLFTPSPVASTHFSLVVFLLYPAIEPGFPLHMVIES